MKTEIKVMIGDGPCLRELYAWDGTLLLGQVFISWDEVCGYCGSLEIVPPARYGIAYRLVREAARVLTEQGVPAVIIHTSGINCARKFYTRLGFVPIVQVPGLMVARMSDINDRLRRTRFCARA